MSTLHSDESLCNSFSTDNNDYEKPFQHYSKGDIFNTLNTINFSKSNVKNNPFTTQKKKQRKDKFGNEISKKRLQRVSFADQVSKSERKLVEVKKVTSIKHLYNITRVDVAGKQCFGCT